MFLTPEIPGLLGRELKMEHATGELPSYFPLREKTTLTQENEVEWGRTVRPNSGFLDCSGPYGSTMLISCKTAGLLSPAVCPYFWIPLWHSSDDMEDGHCYCCRFWWSSISPCLDVLFQFMISVAQFWEMILIYSWTWIPCSCSNWYDWLWSEHI